jgi:hypothetical protein
MMSKKARLILFNINVNKTVIKLIKKATAKKDIYLRYVKQCRRGLECSTSPAACPMLPEPCDSTHASSARYGLVDVRMCTQG